MLRRMAGILYQQTQMKTKPKRQRKYHKRPYHAAKVYTRSGKLVYASCMKRDHVKQQDYKDPDASFWADWKPLRKLCVYANERHNSYTQNGITRYM